MHEAVLSEMAQVSTLSSGRRDILYTPDYTAIRSRQICICEPRDYNPHTSIVACGVIRLANGIVSKPIGSMAGSGSSGVHCLPVRLLLPCSNCVLVNSPRVSYPRYYPPRYSVDDIRRHYTIKIEGCEHEV